MQDTNKTLQESPYKVKKAEQPKFLINAYEKPILIIFHMMRFACKNREKSGEYSLARR